MIIPLLIKSTFRLIQRAKLLSAIKIAGLSMGTAVFLLTSLFGLSEFATDQQHPHAGRIYRYVHQVNTPEGLQRFAFTSATTGPALKERFPEVEGYCRFKVADAVSIRNPESDAAFNEEKFAFADGNVLDFFHFPLANQRPNVLEKPLSVILTPAISTKYFGTENPLGKTLVLNGDIILTVTGVLQNELSGTHLEFDFLASFSSLDVIKSHSIIGRQIPFSQALDNKGFSAFYTYLMLAPDADPQDLIDKFPAFIEEFRGQGRSQRLKPTLQSLTSIHLSSNLLYEIKQNGSRRTVYIYFAIGFLVLVIACVNYLSISTAEFINRAKGVGLKKILGITRATLLWTHVGETAIFAALSLVGGLILSLLVLPQFNSLVSRHLELLNRDSLMTLTSIFCIIVIFSGLYPAWQITRTSGLVAFRGNVSDRPTAFSFRTILALFQLVISFALLALSLLIYHQLDFLLHKDLGFDAEQILVLNTTTATPQQRSVLKKELLKQKVILEVTMTSAPPSVPPNSFGLIPPENAGDEERRILFYHTYVDADFAKAMGLSIQEGRFFDTENPGDSSPYIIVNTAGALAFGDSLLNRSFDIPRFTKPGNNKRSVLGTLADYHFASLHSLVQPLVLELNPEQCRYLLVRCEPKQIQHALSAVGSVWRETLPQIPLDYTFMTDAMAKYYLDEQRQKTVMSGIAIISILLASLGIFGSTLFLVQRRTKEVAIRKTLGSTRQDLLLMLGKPILLLLISSSLLGIPLVLYSGDAWLQQYPYRVGIDPFLFGTSFLVMLAVVLATILHHFLKVTRVNPSQILKQTD